MDGASLFNNSTSPGSSNSGRSSTKQGTRKKLAIEKQSKIDKGVSKNIPNWHQPSVRIVVTKWLSTVILGVLLIVCATTSKVSILALSDSMNNDDKIEHNDYSRIFVMLQILALVPNVVNFVRGVWSGAFRQDIPWPTKKALVLGCFISFIESFGISLFVFNLPGLTKIHNVVLLMNCVFLVPLSLTLYNSFKSPVQSRWRAVFVFVLAFAFEIIGISLTGYSMRDMKHEHIWMAPVGVLLLSISWTPTVFNYLLKSEEAIHSSHADTDEDTDEENYTGTASANPGRSRRTGYQSIRGNVHDSDQMTRRPTSYEETRSINTERSTWKLTIYMSFLKIIFTLGISLLMFNVQQLSANSEGMSLTDYTEGWRKLYKGPSKEIFYFVSNIVTSAIGYSVGYMACTTCMQRWAFAVPLILTTPLTLALLSMETSCEQIILRHTGEVTECSLDNTDRALLYAAAGCLVLAHTLSTGWLIFRSQFLVMLKEDQLFWVPMYNSALLGQWLMLVRRNEYSDVLHEDPVRKAKRSNIIICTTMYREADYEMRQLLESLQGINLAQASGGRHFESHVFFDGAVKDKKPTEFVLQLVSLVESTLGVKAEHCSKIMTPYGMTLTWKLKAESGQTGMIFKIHLKDNFKVKNKKRWSQVMYMSYVLDFLMGEMDGATEDETYILTTDADVRFTPDSVEALLDLMSRDHSVGAVCARTHPLGSGPLVWYQVFEYAIGHWFQKAAEHVIGSVLCSPGCFSVYRCKAIKDILPQYASNVEHAFEFLTKDMGEDRWFCTLMVQSGWRIEYCAASENSTHCPEEFDEFFKQRRRWVASTIANLMLLIKEWHIIAKLNHRVSFVFLIYQAILLFSTLIGPSSVILVISGGLKYSWGWEPIPSLLIQIVICVGFSFVCLFTSSTSQLSVAKLLTFLYAIIMTAVVVGTAVQISTDFTGSEESFISDKIRVSTTTVYIGVMAGIFLLTGIFHLGEFVFLLHGVWYLLCLPAGYLILMIYSICNITDSSWGTREIKTHSVLPQTQNWQDAVIRTFKPFFCNFTKPPETKTIAIQTDNSSRVSSSALVSEGQESMPTGIHEGPVKPKQEATRSSSTDFHLGAIAQEGGERSYRASVYSQEEDEDEYPVVDVKDWLPHDMKQFVHIFIDNGFENTMLISGMTENELTYIGITRKGMKKYLMEEIKKLPDYDIQAEVPGTVKEWLKVIGLEQYQNNFMKEQIKTAKDMEVLKSFGRIELEKELKITKPGHIKRLMYAIRKLRNPTENELRMMAVKSALMVTKSHQLKFINIEEYEFWDTLRNLCLMPQSTAFGLEDDLKEKLGDLRNNWLMIFAVSNTLWLTLIYTLAEKGELLSVFGSNPIGLVVLVLFGLVLVIQFCAMIVHRVATLTHFLGRAPYRFGGTFNTTWAFNDSLQLSDMDARRDRDYSVAKAYGKLEPRKNSPGGEHRPLLADEQV